MPGGRPLNNRQAKKCISAGISFNGQFLQRPVEHDPSFIKCTFAPIAIRKFCSSGRYFFQVTYRLIISNTFTDEIPCCLICLLDFISTANPSSQNSHTEQNFSGNRRIEAGSLRTFPDLPPQGTHYFLCAIVVAFVLQF